MIRKRKTIQDIVPKHTSSRREKISVMVKRTEKTNRKKHSRSVETRRSRVGIARYQKKETGRTWWVLLLFILLSFGVVLLISHLFHKAVVVITPQTESVILDAVYPAYLDPEDGELGFDVIILTEEGTETITPEAKEWVEIPASGTVIIYNELPGPQVLAPQTRLQGSDGTIVLTEDRQIVVPAGTAKAPGSFEVSVVARDPGPGGNIGFSDFVFPAWQEAGFTDQFQKQYARSKAPLQGGFSGKRPILSPETQSYVTDLLQDRVRDTLEQQAKAQRQDSTQIFVPYYESLTLGEVVTVYGENDVLLTLSRELPIVVFQKQEVVDYLGKYTVPGYHFQKATLANEETLSLRITESVDANLAFTPAIRWEAQGLVTFVPSLDIDDIRQKLLGSASSEFENTMNSYGDIHEASLLVRPLWRSVVPRDPLKIIISQQEIEGESEISSTQSELSN
ncbi:MAG: hypothetical protein ACI83D_000201 [Planctomycetota bacterium]|jgi:hypothetical protein